MARTGHRRGVWPATRERRVKHNVPTERIGSMIDRRAVLRGAIVLSLGTAIERWIAANDIPAR